MAILTQDNKVLVNASGDVYKTAPIIDISSTYGVTKDGGNLVSAVKNKNNANKFRGITGRYPIENGNGLEFTGGVSCSKMILTDCLGTIRHPWIFIRVKIVSAGNILFLHRSDVGYTQRMFLMVGSAGTTFNFQLGSYNRSIILPSLGTEFRFCFITSKGDALINNSYYVVYYTGSGSFGELFESYDPLVNDNIYSAKGKLALGDDSLADNFSVGSSVIRSLKIYNNMKIAPHFKTAKAIAENFVNNNVDYNG